MNNMDLLMAFGQIDEDLLRSCEEAEFRTVPEKAKPRFRWKSWGCGIAAVCCAAIAIGSFAANMRCGSAATEAAMITADSAEVPMEAPAAMAEESEPEERMTAGVGGSLLAGGENGSIDGIKEKNTAAGAATARAENIFEYSEETATETEEDAIANAVAAGETIEWNGQMYRYEDLTVEAIEETELFFEGWPVYQIKGIALEEAFALVTDAGEALFFVRVDE